MLFSRNFTRGNLNPAVPCRDIEFVKRSSRLEHKDGSVAFEMKELIAPVDWSQTAVDVLAQKYFRKAGVPSHTVRRHHENMPDFLLPSVPAEDAVLGSETDARQVFHRLAGAWTHHGWIEGYFTDEESARVFYDEIVYMLARQIAAPNSPQFFNCGLWWSYGIEGESRGWWRVFPDFALGLHGFPEPAQTSSAYRYPQLSACFIQQLDDNLLQAGGIEDLVVKEARVFAGGSGSGINYSELRGEGEPLSGGGCSSGLMSFLKLFDVNAGVIKSGGTVRRASRMVCLDADHPDIERFVTWKWHEEMKVAALVLGARLLQEHLEGLVGLYHEAGPPEHSPALREALLAARKDGVPDGCLVKAMQMAEHAISVTGVEPMDVDWEGEAYRTVSGQNANNSVRLTDAFIAAVRTNDNWPLYWRTEKRQAARAGRQPVPCKVIKARALMDLIATAAWHCADPGMQFDTTINDWNTVPQSGRVEASNPCSEYLHINSTSCNLASIYLCRFLAQDGSFDVASFAHAVRIWTVVLDITVGLSQYPSRELAAGTYATRALGLSAIGIGALLMRKGIPYDSDEGRAWGAALACILHCHAYATSAELAGELGTFPDFAKNKEAMLRVIHNHAAAAQTSAVFMGLAVQPPRLDAQVCPRVLLEAARHSAAAMVQQGLQHGFRNAQISLAPPSGTIGLLMDADTLSIEPDYSLIKLKKLAGGGYFTLVNRSVEPALHALGYAEAAVQEMLVYLHGTRHLSAMTPRWRRLLAEQPSEATPEELFALFNSKLKGAFSLHTVVDREATGLSPDEFEELNVLLCGHGTLEGAPHLKPEHYPVFDCAVRCGRYGKRCLSPEAHLRMVAAIQPFLSGGASKTINAPADIAPEALKDVYLLAHDLGIKCLAIYRDGSKLSQPLNAVIEETAAADKHAPPLLDDASAEVFDPQRPAHETAESSNLQREVSERQGLPNRRGGWIQKSRIGGHTLFLQTGEYPDGHLGEIFLTMSKQGSTLGSMVDCFAISVSLGLQYGVPLAEYVEAFRGTRFEPSGPVEGHPDIKMASSILDFVFHALERSYGSCSRIDAAAATTASEVFTAVTSPEVVTRSMSLRPRQRGPYEDTPCNSCGRLMMTRSGSCLTCQACGATSGGCG
jgi:ribonucleoside-diphosphate reductase alpha chain